MSKKRVASGPSILLEAVKRVKIGNESKKSVSRDLSIPKTNLLRHLVNVNNEIDDITTATDDELLDVLAQSSKIGAYAVCFIESFVV